VGVQGDRLALGRLGKLSPSPECGRLFAPRVTLRRAGAVVAADPRPDLCPACQPTVTP
jgi:hypothetical protein